MHNELGNEWVRFQQVLIDAEAMLKKHKERFRSNLLAQSEEFKKQVANLMEEFTTKGPFSATIATAVSKGMMMMMMMMIMTMTMMMMMMTMMMMMIMTMTMMMLMMIVRTDLTV
jgi:hypothetical protein